jgi:hypothetical protein
MINRSSMLVALLLLAGTSLRSKARHSQPVILKCSNATAVVSPLAPLTVISVQLTVTAGDGLVAGSNDMTAQMIDQSTGSRVMLHRRGTNSAEVVACQLLGVRCHQSAQAVRDWHDPGHQQQQCKSGAHSMD